MTFPSELRRPYRFNGSKSAGRGDEALTRIMKNLINN
jgi:hypothetical protein